MIVIEILDNRDDDVKIVVIIIVITIVIIHGHTDDDDSHGDSRDDELKNTQHKIYC